MSGIDKPVEIETCPVIDSYRASCAECSWSSDDAEYALQGKSHAAHYLHRVYLTHITSEQLTATPILKVVQS